MLKTITGATPAATPLYSVMLLLGAFTAYIMLNIFMRKGGFSKFVKKRVRRSLCWSAIFATLLSNMANWLFHEEMQSMSLYARFTEGGIAFMVWILCFIGISALFLRMYKLDVKKCLDIIVPPLLMATFLARVGCSFGGCCYGIDISVFGYVIPFPVREIEALFALTLSIVLCAAFKGKRLAIYLVAYPAFLCAEFLRGDDRGTFFGLPFLSPTQVICALTVITAVTVIIINAVTVIIINAVKSEKAKRAAEAAEFQAEQLVAEAVSEQPVTQSAEGEQENEQPAEAPAASPEKQPKPKYVPRPVDFNDPKIRANPLRIIFNILLALGVAVTAFFAYNPFSFRWVSNVNYYVRDALGFVFDEGGTSNEAGSTTSLEVLDVSDKSPVYNNGDAFALVSSLDNLGGHSYMLMGTRPLSNGNTLYTFAQTVNDIPVYGKTVSLVVDDSYSPLYTVMDEASEVYTAEIVKSFGKSDKHYSTYFENGYTVIDSVKYYYDTGEGLFPVKLITLSDRAQKKYGVLVEAESEALVAFVDIYGASPLEARANAIIKAAEKAVNVIGGKDTAYIKKISKQKFKKLDLQNTASAIESALCKAYLKSGLSADEFITALKTATEIAASKCDLSEQLFCDILAQTVEQLAADKGDSSKKAEKAGENVYSAFRSCGIKKASDEKPVHIDVRERKSVVKNTIGSAEDTDILKLSMEENSVMRFEISTDISIDIEIYSADGKNVLTTYASSDTEFALYPEDGTDYVVKIKASDAQASLWAGEEDYKVTVNAEPRTDEMPSFINTAMYEMSASFASSKGYMFGLLFYGDAAFTDEEFATLSVLPAIDGCNAACSSGCAAELDLPEDSVKQVILETLLVDKSGVETLTITAETTMEISCFRYIETNNGALVKAKINAKDAFGNECEGYCFFRLEHFEEIHTFDVIVTLAEELQLDAGNAQIFATALNKFFGQKYYVTELNTAGLLSAFGDSFGNISDQNGMPSLYDFWKNDSKYSYLKLFDKQAAINAGYSKETVNEFEKYTICYNIAYCQKVYDNLSLISSTAQLHASGVVAAYDVYSVATDPVGYALGELEGNWKILDAVYRVYKIKDGLRKGKISSVYDGVADEAKGDFIGLGVDTYAEQLEQDAAIIKEYADEVHKVKENYEAQKNGIDEGYFWELFF